MRLFVTSLLLMSSALASEEGVIVNHPDDLNVDVEEVVSVGDPWDISSSDNMEEEESISDNHRGPLSVVTATDTSAYSVTYDVTADQPDEGILEGRGAVQVSGEVSVGIQNGHGHAAAAASSKAVVKIGNAEAEAEDTAALAVAQAGSMLIGGSITIAGFGGGGTVQVSTAGDEESTASYADTDATGWKNTNSAIVTASWAAGYTLEANKVMTSSSSSPASATANALAHAVGTVTFRVTIEDEVEEGTPPPSDD